MWTSPLTCSIFAEPFSWLTLTLPVTSSIEVSECCAETSTSPSRPDDIYVAAARSNRDRSFARQGNIEIHFDRMIARSLGFGVDRNQASDGGNCGLGFVVVLVGVVSGCQRRCACGRRP